MVWYCILINGMIWYCILIKDIVLYCIASNCIILYCIVLYNILWYNSSIVYYCIVLYSILPLTSYAILYLIFIFAFPRWHFLLFLKPLQQQLLQLNFPPLGYFNNCPVLRVPGRVYPVDIYHSKMQQTMTLRGPSNTSYVQVLYISNLYLLFTFFCLICAIWH